MRNDGKPARAPRLGVPADSLIYPSQLGPADVPPPWHELVQPGPAGFPARTRERRQRLGQVVTLNRIPVRVDPAPSGPVRAGRYRPLRKAKALPIWEARWGMERIRQRPTPTFSRRRADAVIVDEAVGMNSDAAFRRFLEATDGGR